MTGPRTATTLLAPHPGRDLRGLADALDRVTDRVVRTAPRAGLHGVALAVLGSVAADGPQRMSQLAERERISQPGMSRVIQRLAGAGLIERADDPADGRVVIVTITPSGRALLVDLQTARLQFLVDLLSGLPDDDLGALCAAVGALDALGTTPPAHPSACRPDQATHRPGGDSNRRDST